MDQTLFSSVLHTTVAMAVPLLLAALGELLVERAGMVNIGLEGMILVGAFAAMVAAYFTGQPWFGVLAGILAGMVLAVLLIVPVIGFGANQIVCGTALNLLALGATGVGYRAVFGLTGSALIVSGFEPWPLPALSHLPLVGSAFFAQPVLGYLAFLAVPAIAYGLHRTLPGLAWRMTGEDPYAARAHGVAVQAVRSAALVACGGLAGLAGSYLVLAYAKTFVEGISAGRGFIALAVVIFGGWSAWGILGAASLFGFATAVQFHVQALGLPVPYQAALAFPYLLTLVVLAFSGAGWSAPRALGKEPQE